MRILESLKAKSKHLKKESTALYYAYQHPNVSRLPRLIILFTLGYALSPIDLIPDFIPILGYVDDLIIIPALISFSINLIPQDILEASRKEVHSILLNIVSNYGHVHRPGPDAMER